MHYWYFGSDDSCSCSVVCCLVHFTMFDIILGLYPLDSSITPTFQIMTIKNVSRHQHIFFRGQNYPQLRTIDSHKFCLSSYIFYDLCHFCLTSHHDSFFFFFPWTLVLSSHKALCYTGKNMALVFRRSRFRFLHLTPEI